MNVSTMFTAKVKNGQVVIDPSIELREGATVTVLVDDAHEDRELTPDQEAEIDDAVAEAERDGWIPAEQIIAELRAR